MSIFMSNVVQVQCAVADAAAADAIIEALVRDRLAACGQRVGPIRSSYWWDGAVQHADEWLIVLKTTAECAAAATQRIEELHAYDTPEVLVLPVHGGSARYLDWVRAEVRPPS